MSWTYKPSSHSSGNRNALEVDSGTTENDLSGLIGLTGVTHHVNEDHVDVYEIAADTRIIIRGTLYHNPDTEILILHHTNTSLTTSTATSALGISGTATNPAFYYYGTTRTNSYRGTSTNSKSTGLIFTGKPISNWHPGDACHGGSGSNANFVGRGGVILTGRPCTGSFNLDVIGTTWRGTTSALEWRNPFGNSNGSFNGTFDGIAVLLPAFNATFNFSNSSIGEVINTSAITEHTLREFDVSQNINDYDIGSDGMNGRAHREYEVINSATGTDVVKMWRNTRGPVGQRGVVVTKKEVSFNFKDASGTAIEDVKLYLEDNPSAYAKNAVFLKSKSSDATNGYASSGDSTITRGVVNTNGDMVYDYTTSEVYSKTSDASGDIAKFEVLTGVQIHEYNTNDSDAATIYGMHIHSNGKWVISSSNSTQASYQDWDTSNFGNFYKVDRRSDSNTNADDFTFKFCSYGHSLSSSTQALKGLGELSVNWVLFDDLVITDTRSTTDAYTVIDTPEKFYNRAKAYLVDNYAGEADTLVSRDGNTIDAGSYDVVIDASAGSVFTISGNTLTIKATTFVGNITTSGSTTLSNGAKVIGTFGSTTVLPWEIKNAEATSRIQLVNVTKSNTLVHTEKLSGSAGDFIDVTGSYNGSQISVGDVIRLRVTCVVAKEAMLPVELNGVATDAGITFRVDQVADEVYNSNGVDGSDVEKRGDNPSGTLVSDFVSPQMGVDINDGDGTASAKEIYAYFTYATTTADGVANWFGGMRAIDNGNYEVKVENADIRLQNIGSNSVIVTGGRLYRDDGASILHAEDGDKPIVIDSGALNLSVLPQIQTALSESDTLTTINNNTKLIPGLL